MASIGDYNFLSASANGYMSFPNDFTHQSALLSAPLKSAPLQAARRVVGRAVPSYSTQISGNSVPSYSTQAVFNKNQNPSINNINRSLVPSTPSYVRRAARQPASMHIVPSASIVASNSAAMIRQQNAAEYFDGNITHVGVSASAIPFNSASMVRRQPLAAHSAYSLAQPGPNFAESQVPLNQDPNPILVKKKPAAPVHYTQNISVKVSN